MVVQRKVGEQQIAAELAAASSPTNYYRLEQANSKLRFVLCFSRKEEGGGDDPSGVPRLRDGE